MSLKLVLGPANSAKAGVVLGDCAGAAARGAVLVVPTREDVERYERELAQRGAVLGAAVVTFAGLMREIARRAGYRPARLTSLQRERVLRLALGRARLRAIDRSAASPGFPNAAWALISELERSLVTPERFSAALRSWAARDPRRYRYAQDLAAVYVAYARELRRRGRVDGELYAGGAVDALGAAPELWGSAPVFVYGFDDLTPIERYALETLSGPAGAEVVVSLTWEQDRTALAARGEAVQGLAPGAFEVVELPALADYYEPQSGPALHHLERNLFEPHPSGRVNPGAAIRLLEAGGERAEVELVASEVLGLLRAGVSPSEIVVVYRSLRRVGPLIERVFAACGVPIAMRRAVALFNTSLGRGVRALIRCALLGERSASAADLVTYLRTPGVLAELETADRVEAAIRRKAVRTAAEAISHTDLRLVEFDVLRDASDTLEELDRQVRRLFASHRRGLAPVLDHREELDALALSVLLRALEELRELDEPLGATELIDALEGLTVPVREASCGEAVLVAEPLEIRARRFRAVFVCGLQESEFPRAGSPDPLLNDELRGELAAIAASNGNGGGLELRPREDMLEHERYLFYTSVTRATEQVILSYRSSDEEGGIELPSPFIADVADLLDEGWMARRRRRLLADVVWSPGDAPTAREEARAQAVQAAQARAAQAPATRHAAPATRQRVLGEAALGHVRHRRIVSAGALESYANCPVRWLVERELQVEPLAPESDSLVRGQVVHRVLEELYRRLERGVSESTLERARSIVAAILRERSASVGAGRPAAIRAGLVRAIEADIDRFLTLEVSSGAEWPPQHVELRFGFADEPGEGKADEPGEDEARRNEDGEAGPGDLLPALELPGGARVRGVIDRVDVEPAPTAADGDARRGAVVRDYKTGGARPDYQGARWAADRQLQVPLYMLAVREVLSLDPVAGFYQPLGGDDLRPRGVFVEGAPVGSEVVRTDARTAEEVREELDSAARRAADLAAGLRMGLLEPRPDTCSRCGCAYPGICRAG